MDKGGNTDRDGWAYGLNFPLLTFPPTSVPDLRPLPLSHRMTGRRRRNRSTRSPHDRSVWSDQPRDACLVCIPELRRSFP